MQKEVIKIGGVYFKEGENYAISDKAIISATYFKAQSKVQVTATKQSNKSTLKCLKRISKNLYVDERTKEIKEYAQNEVKSEKAIKRSMRNFEKILCNNFNGSSNERFITLTTAIPITYIKEMKNLMKSFLKTLKRHFGKDIKYAYTLEMQQTRESWHVHMMIKCKAKISNWTIQKYWHNGETRTTKITDKYTDFEIDEEKAMTQPDSFIAKQTEYGINAIISYMSKHYTKETLPTGIRAYTVSRNLEKPLKIKMTYGDFKEECTNKGFSKQSEYTTLIISEDTGNILNRVKNEDWYQ